MQLKLSKTQIPWLLAASRTALGALVAAGAAGCWSGIILATMTVAALLSDIFDGILARRWHCDTPAVRLFDSMADTVFFVGVAISLWFAQPHLLRAHWPLLSALLALEALRLIFDFAKFGKAASYHSYLSKAWGVVLAVAVVTAFAKPNTHASDLLLSSALTLGIVCNLEGLAMSLILPAWRNDIKTLRTAWQLRQILFDRSRTVKAA